MPRSALGSLTPFVSISSYRADEMRGASCHPASGAAGREHHERRKCPSHVRTLALRSCPVTKETAGAETNADDALVNLAALSDSSNLLWLRPEPLASRWTYLRFKWLSNSPKTASHFVCSKHYSKPEYIKVHLLGTGAQPQISLHSVPRLSIYSSRVV